MCKEEFRIQITTTLVMNDNQLVKMFLESGQRGLQLDPAGQVPRLLGTPQPECDSGRIPAARTRSLLSLLQEAPRLNCDQAQQEVLRRQEVVEQSILVL